MKRCRFALLAALAPLLAAPRPAAAQFVELGGHASYTKASGADGSWAGGAQVRGRFIGAEGLIDYKRTTYSFAGVDTLRVEQYPVQASLMLWLFPREWSFQMYALGGGGWYHTRSTFLGPEGALGTSTTNRFGGHAGGGIEILAGDHVALYGDVRWVWLDVDSIDAIRDRYDNNPKADFLHVTTGISYRF
jgi:hypothetical protein